MRDIKDGYVCAVATSEQMEQKWEYEIGRHPSERKNWTGWKEEAVRGFLEGKAIPYYGVLHGEVICEATAVISPDAVRHGEGLVGGGAVYLCAFRTNEPCRGKGYFSRLFAFMLDDLRKRGYRTATLGVEVGDRKNRAIYTHYGFTRYIRTENDVYPDGSVITAEYFAREIGNGAETTDEG